MARLYLNLLESAMFNKDFQKKDKLSSAVGTDLINFDIVSLMLITMTE